MQQVLVEPKISKSVKILAIVSTVLGIIGLILTFALSSVLPAIIDEAISIIEQEEGVAFTEEMRAEVMEILVGSMAFGRVMETIWLVVSIVLAFLSIKKKGCAIALIIVGFFSSFLFMITGIVGVIQHKKYAEQMHAYQMYLKQQEYERAHEQDPFA